jgi:hypothetical protein
VSGAAQRRSAIGSAALLVAIAMLWAVTQPADACGCGIAIDASVSEESGLVIDQPGKEQIILSLELSSDSGQRAAVVLPVPGDPEVAAIEQGDPLAYLDAATQPPPEVGAAAGGGETATAAPPVEVIGREEIGGYDVSRLAADDPKALDEWLDENGYTLPDGAEPILSDYVRQGWRFVAIRLASDSDGRLKPLRVSFATDIPVYPMRLSQLARDPIDLTLYTLADGQRQVEGLETVWTGTVGQLDPPPPPELADLFAEGEFVTRMEASSADPSAFKTDLVVEPLTDAEAAATAADVTPVAAAPPSKPADDGPQGVWQTLVVFAVALTIFFVISRLGRRRARASDAA